MGPAADGSAGKDAPVNTNASVNSTVIAKQQGSCTGPFHAHRTMNTSPEHIPEPSHLPPASTRLPVLPDHGTTVPEHYQVKALSAKIAAVTAIFGSNGAIYGVIISSSQRTLQL